MQAEYGDRSNAQVGHATQVVRQANAGAGHLPLAGTAPTGVLADASLLMIAPGGAGALVPGTFGSLRAGARWTGTDLVPTLEILDATVLGTHYDKIDLTSSDSVMFRSCLISKTNIQPA